MPRREAAPTLSHVHRELLGAVDADWLIKPPVVLFHLLLSEVAGDLFVGGRRLILGENEPWKMMLNWRGLKMRSEKGLRA